MNRSRIVVNVDGAVDPARAVAARARPSGGRVWRIIGVLLVLLGLLTLGIIAAGFFWWRSYQQKPAYSLALLVDAAQRNDMETVNSLVDTDRVVENFVPQVRERVASQFGGPLGGVVMQQVEAFLPKVLPRVKESVREELPALVRDLSARAAGRPFLLIALAMPYVVDVKQEGETATVVIKLPDRTSELTLQRRAETGRWVIVGVKDEVLLARVVGNVMKGLPVGGGAAGHATPGKGTRPAAPPLPLPIR